MHFFFLLGLLSIFIHRGLKEFVHIFVDNFILRFELFFLKRQASGLQCAGVGHQDGVFEVSHIVSLLFNQDRVGSDQFVFQTLLDTDLSGDFVLEISRGESKHGVFGDHIVEESSGGLRLQHVVSVDVSLEHGGSQFRFFGFSFTGTDENVQHEHIVDLEFVVFHLLVKGFFVDDGSITIEEELLHVVRQHTFHGVHLVSIGTFLNNIGNLIIDISRFK